MIGSSAIFRHVSESGQRVLNGTETESGADVVVVAAHDEFSYDELRVATQAVLGGAEMIAAGRDRTFPEHGRAVAGDGGDRGGAGIRDGSHRPGGRQTRIRRSSSPPWTGSDPAARWSWAIVSTQISKARTPPGSTARSCSPASPPPTRRQAAEKPAPVAVAADLRALVIAGG